MTRKEEGKKRLHDVRNTLAVMKMDAEVALMDDTAKEEKLREVLERVLEHVDVIDKLLG